MEENMNTDNILNTNDVLVGNPVSLKQTDDKKIFAILSGLPASLK